MGLGGRHYPDFRRDQEAPDCPEVLLLPGVLVDHDFLQDLEDPVVPLVRPVQYFHLVRQDQLVQQHPKDHLVRGYQPDLGYPEVLLVLVDQQLLLVRVAQLLQMVLLVLEDPLDLRLLKDPEVLEIPHFL